MMSSPSVFISYSHADEWLKDELITHFSALKRNGSVSIWHDRMIPAGGILKDEIDEKVKTSDIFLFLISPNFLASDYCFEKEFLVAVSRRDKGEAEIVPIIVRDCDWNADRLKSFNALPPDGIAVTRNAGPKAESHHRDAAWLRVIEGLKDVIAAQKKRLEPPSLLSGYIERLFKVDFVRHSYMMEFDESKIFVEPDVYSEKSKEQFADIEAFYKIAREEKAVLIVGNDRSGKTVLAKRLQVRMQADGTPCIFLNGPSLKNTDLIRYVRKARFEQFGTTDYPENKFGIIIDDFDECNLSDRIKESFIAILCIEFKSVCIVSYSSAPMVLFTSESLPDPAVFKLNALTDDKLFALVQRWNSVSLDANETLDDRAVLTMFERLQLIFTQTELDKLPYTAVTFLELIESSTGADIAFSSFAACYDTLITNRLNSIGVNWRSLDESKNFLALLAYKSYIDGGNGIVSHKNFEESLIFFEEQFLSSSLSLRKMAIPHFLKLAEGGYRFSEDYLWFFLCARYVVKTLQLTDRKKYVAFIQECTNSIFQKKYANIVIYISYFAEDNFVVESLLATLDDLFSKADSWVLSDDTREIMLGLVSNDQLQIESKSDVSENRNGLLRNKVTDIVIEAEKVVARYTLPFLNADIEDSSLIEQIDVSTIDADSYMKSVNALLRIHSVIGQILSGRAGTYSANFMLDCISRMVKASGRYASLNHAIATILVFNKEISLDEIDRAYSQKGLSKDEKFDKVVRIFTFWSVYLSHAGLARYLSQEHTIRALNRLAETNENVYCQTSEGNTPFNFTAVSIIANLYHTNKVDREEIDRCLKSFGEHSALMSILRMAFHMYAYYMPVSYKDKQWLAEKLNMSLQKLEVQSVKSTDSRRLARPSRKLLGKA